MTGRYAPPATHMPMMAVICGMPMALITALLRNTRPKSSVSGNTSSCSGKNTPGGIDQINRGNMIVDGNILRADHFFCCKREEAPAFTVASLAMIITSRPQTRRQSGNRPRRRRAAPFLIHFVRGKNSQLKK